MDKAEITAREAERWAEFRAALEAVPRDRWDEPSVVPGWTIKSIVRHTAGWMEDLVVHLESMIAGTFLDPNETDEVIDARNAGFAEEAIPMSADELRDGLVAAREASLARWAELEQIDAAAVEWFEGETTEHYEEHLPDLRAAAGA